MITLAVHVMTALRASNRYGDLAHDESLLDENQHDQREDDRQGTMVRHAAVVVNASLLPSSSSWLWWNERGIKVRNGTTIIVMIGVAATFFARVRPAGENEGTAGVNGRLAKSKHILSRIFLAFHSLPSAPPSCCGHSYKL